MCWRLECRTKSIFIQLNYDKDHDNVFFILALWTTGLKNEFYCYNLMTNVPYQGLRSVDLFTNFFICSLIRKILTIIVTPHTGIWKLRSLQTMDML